MAAKGVLTARTPDWLPEEAVYTELEGNILDLGTGKASFPYKSRGNLYRLSSHTEGFHDTKNLVVADALNLPYPNGFFKHIICGWSVPYYFTPSNGEERQKEITLFINELDRVLEDKGSVYIYPLTRWDLDEFLRYSDRFTIKHLRMPKGDMNRMDDEYYRVTMVKK